VGGLGFVMWVVIVSILGPAFLHKLLATGAMFMTQAASSAGRQAAVAGKLAMNVAQGAGLGGASSLLQSGPGPGERLTAARPAEAWAFTGTGGARADGTGSAASMHEAARSVDVSGGKDGSPM
jgi:hypothetical protein